MRKVFFAVFMFMYALGLALNLLVRSIDNVLEISILATSLYFAFSLINKVLSSRTDANSQLDSSEKKKVIITEIFSPIIVGAFYYYSWKKSFPLKAKEANRYSWMILLVQLLLYIGIVSLIGTLSGVKIHP